MTVLSLDVEGLDDNEVAALEQYHAWCTEHPGRTGSISILTAEDQAEMRWWIEDHCPDALLLWADDGSNYAGAYRTGPMRGMVFILMHDDEDVSPRFASVRSLVDQLMTDTVDVRDFGMIFSAESGPGDFPPREANAELLGIAREAFAAGKWADPSGHDEPIEDPVEFEAQQIQAYDNALALVPVDAVPLDLLDDIADALLVSRNMTLWQGAPSLLRDADFRGLGTRLAALLDRQRKDERRDELIDPIRSLIRTVR